MDLFFFEFLKTVLEFSHIHYIKYNTNIFKSLDQKTNKQTKPTKQKFLYLDLSVFHYNNFFWRKLVVVVLIITVSSNF